MTAYYNDTDPAAAHILRAMIDADVIAPGVVDTRSIKELTPDDLAGFTQCHFFAGGGLWSVAARLAGWPDDAPLWTGSCPCQPFSAAGKGLGTDDPRHLWPDFHRLIRECRPAVVFGEQVSNAAGARRPIDAHMHEMWHREAILGLLQEPGQARQFEWLSCAMQEVLQGEAGGLSEWYEAASVGFASQISGREPGACACECGADAGEAGGHPLRPRRICRCYSGENKSGHLRIDGLTVPSGWRSDMGQPFARPDCPGTWLRDHERQGGSLRGQRDDEHLGRRTDHDSSRCDQDTAGTGRGASSIQMGAEAEGAPGLDWLDGIVFDLDAIGYSTRFADFPACSVDAPHQRNRLYWIAVDGRMADDDRIGPATHRRDAGEVGGFPVAQRRPEDDAAISRRIYDQAVRRISGADTGVTQGDAFCSGLEGQRGHGDGSWRQEPDRPVAEADGAVTTSDVGDHFGSGCAGARVSDERGAQVSLTAGPDGRSAVGAESLQPDTTGAGRDASAQAGIHRQAQGERAWHGEPQRSSRPLGRNGTYWSDAEWIECHDGKARRAQSGIRFLVDGLPGRVDLWRVGGNAIVPEAAAEVIAAFMDSYGVPATERRAVA